MTYDQDLIVEAAIKTILVTQDYVSDQLHHPNIAFAPSMVTEKAGLWLDFLAEWQARKELEKRLGAHYPLILVGEEFAPTFVGEADPARSLTVLLDMIDGTDLLHRNLAKWCSAMVFFDPKAREDGPRIVAAFVAIAQEAVYYAGCDREGAFLRTMIVRKGNATKLGHEQVVDGPSHVDRLEDASIAWGGQKVSSFLSVTRHESFMAEIQQLVRPDDPPTRIYNLAGNTLMARLVHGWKRLDAIFNVKGQYAHDFVAGAYVAIKGGAVLKRLDALPFGADRLAAAVADDLAARLSAQERPRTPYVLAATDKLASRLLSTLGTRTAS